MLRKHASLLRQVCVGFLLVAGIARAQNKLESILPSVVRIQATSMHPDYRTPWNTGRVGRGTGSGFVVAGKQVMTNAHVVSNARFLGLVRSDGPKVYPAKVKFIAHDCDLALLEVEDESFFTGLTPLEFGSVPELHSTVVAVGYPIGGQRVSVTRGVVSRIEFRTYVHSSLDAHLAIQIDAAINPGNSGGPVMQDGKVVGVAFQGISGAVAQNTSYMIPPPVVLRFLKDVEDGRYDGYCEAAFDTFPLLNQQARQRLGLANDNLGVLVTTVSPEGSSDGYLETGDILLKIDGHDIASDGYINLNGERIRLIEIVERKYRGDIVTLELLRKGQKKEVKIPLKGAWFYSFMARHYDVAPRYLVFSGLLFQPLNIDFMATYRPTDADILDYFDFFVRDHIYLERPEMVVLSSVLSDSINTQMEYFQLSLVDEVNGTKITSLRVLDEVLSKPAEKYVFKLMGRVLPLVIEADKIEAATKRIAEKYGITNEKNIGQVPNEVK